MTESILEEAQRIIHGARSAAYGHPRDNFQNIADVWNGYLQGRRDRPIDTMDVANLMILMKVARLNGTGYHRDSVTDIAGYAGTIERLQEPVEAPEPQTKPRQWDSVHDIPEGVVASESGPSPQYFRRVDGTTQVSSFRDEDGWIDVESFMREFLAPFTEVL